MWGEKINEWMSGNFEFLFGSKQLIEFQEDQAMEQIRRSYCELGTSIYKLYSGSKR